MRLRTKIAGLFSFLVFVALAVSVVRTSTQMFSLMTDHVKSELNVIADIQKSRLEELITGYLKELRLTANRTGIIELLSEYNKKPEKETKNSLLARLNDAKKSSDEFEKIMLFDNNKNLVVETLSPTSLFHDPSDLSQDNKIHFIYKDNRKYLVLHTPIRDDLNIIGYIIIYVNPKRILQLSGDFTGLGATGETTIGAKFENGDAFFINDMRFKEYQDIIIPKDRNEVPTIKALNKENGFTDTAIDYRNKKVFAAYRYIPSTDWALVVKIDKEEILSPIYQKIYINIVIEALIFVFLLVIVLYSARFITEPLEELSLAANEISKGNLEYKIKESTKDEIGRLAKDFNEMAIKIKESRSEIDRKVTEQTHEIVEKSKYLEEQQQATLNILDDVNIEKKKNEELAKDLEKFKLAVDNASDHIVITDQEGIVLYANKSVERITEFPISEVIGKKAGNKDLWGGMMEKDVYSSFWNIIKTQKKPFIGDFNNKRKSGEAYIARATVSPVLDHEGNVVFFIGIERDITKEKEIDKAKTEFVSLASHQLRTPLTAIKWHTELLLDGDVGEVTAEQKKYLHEINEGSQRMVDLVNALLNVSRLELGTFSVSPEPTDVVKIVRSVLDEIKLQVDEKNIGIEEKHESIPLISLDPKLFRIIVQNLFTNAIKYTPKNGHVSSELSIRKKSEIINNREITEDSLVFVVSDNGYGIPISQQNKVFEKLFRADNVKDKETDGTGLGLYIIKSIVEHSKGMVWFESQENKGTTFYIVLPLTGMSKKEGTRAIE